MNIFQFIKSRVSITQIINDYTALKKAGVYWKGACPFHHERTPSFTVTPHKDIFYCFGCHQGGDIIAFITRAENCSPLEAARYIADRYGVELPKDITWDKTDEHLERKRRYHALCSLVAQWCSQQLESSRDASNYVASRHITQKSKELFTIGYFPPGKTALQKLLAQAKKEGFITKDFIDAHIILDGKHGLYCPFEERIIFPIRDHLGNYCGFGGRVFRAEDSRAKYYNSHDHEFFSKGSLLFGFDCAKRSIQGSNKIFLVEGYIDCIAMVQAGFGQTVATLGTACSAEHMKTIARYTHNLFVMYDGDAAGHKAMTRLGELCFEVDMELNIVMLPDGEDPASCLQKELDLELLTEKSQNIFSFYIDQVQKDYSQKNLHEKLSAITELLEIVAQVKDPLRQELLLQKAATTCALPLGTLKQKLKGNKIAPPAEKPKKNVKRENLSLEKQIFCAIMELDGDVINLENEQLLKRALPDSLFTIIEKLQLAKRSCQDAVDFSTFFGTLSSQEQALTSRLLLQQGSYHTQESWNQLFDQLIRKQWKIMVNDVKIKLADAQKSEDTQAIQEAVTEFQELRKTMLRKGLNDS